MKKLSLIILAIFLIQTECSADFFKKSDVKIQSNSGYVGTLPDLRTEYSGEQSNISLPIFDKTETFHSENNIKPVPRNDPTFANIILKQDKISPYIADLQEFIDIFEKIYDSIDNEENVQRFSSRVYFLNINTDYFKEKYANKPESSYITYTKIIELSQRAQQVSELRTEAEKYKKYLAYTDTGAMYDSRNINNELDDLKVDIERTITLLKETR